MIVSIVIILAAVSLRDIAVRQSSSHTISEEVRYNCHLKAITSLFFSDAGQLAGLDYRNAKRTIPAYDQVQIAVSPGSRQIKHNVIIVILEGVQYRYTSLAEPQSKLTPYLAALAKQGAEFTNTRSTLTHTTKVIFSLLTGLYPSASQDIAETVPAAKPYAGIATILKRQMNFRTAFFQSAKGSFEARPGMVYNLGFDKFWARDDLNDPNAFLGYLACDEFALLKPISEWIIADSSPFLLTILCSVTHDPYEVPEWYATPAAEPLERRPALLRAFAKIRRYEGELAERLLSGLREISDLRIWGISDLRRLNERVPTCAITRAGTTPVVIARQLAHRGIFVWHGNYYALPLTEELGLEPGGMVRIGLLHYNTAEEVDRLLEALRNP